MKKLFIFLAMSLFTIALNSAADATPVSGLIATDGSNTLFSDNSGDLFINRFGEATTVDVGDIFVTIVGINSIESSNTGTQAAAIGTGTGYNEVTAIVAAKIASGPIFTFVNGQGITMGVYDEAPLDATDIPFFNWATGDILGGLYTFTTQLGLTNNGTQLGLVYEDAANNYTRDSTLQDGFNTSTDGDYRLTLGLVPPLGNAPLDHLNVFAPVDLTSFGLLPFATAVDSSSISLDGTILAQNWPGLFFNSNFTGGNGGFSRPTETSEFPVFDNLDFTLNATTTVPEPSTVALLGFGLVGAGLFGRIRRRKH